MTTVSSHAPGRPIWFDLSTSDPAAAREFYGALFGWTYDISGPELGYYAMCKSNGRNAAGLGGMPPGSNFPPAWTVYFGTADLDASLAKVKAAGGNVMQEAMEIPGQGRLAVATDSTGAVFGFWEPAAHTGAQVVNEHGALAWCEVNTRDHQAATTFYHNVIGLEPEALPEGATPSAYIMLKQGDEPVCGVMQMTADWGDAPPHWMAYFAVDDCDASCDTVKAKGGTVSHGPFDTPYGRMAVIQDPQGAHVSIIRLTEQ